MSDVSLNMIRRSCVKEQAYLPLRSPESMCVCRAVSKGSCSIFRSRILYCSFSERFLFKSFPAFLRKDGAKSIFFRFIYYSLKCFVGGFKSDRGFLFCFQYPLHKSLFFTLLFDEKGNKIPHFFKGILGKGIQHLFDIVYLIGSYAHKNIISQFIWRRHEKD